MGKVFGQKKFIIITVAVLVTASIIFIIFPKDNEFIEPTGAAVAVMTSPPVVYDGLWSPTRHTDEFCYPLGIEHVNGELYVADYFCDRIQIIDGNENIRIGSPGQYGLSYIDSGALVDGLRENAHFMKPSDISVRNNVIFVADTGNHCIRRIDGTYVLTIAGSGNPGYAEGREREASFNSPRSVAADDEYIYVADTLNHCIRRVDKSGNTSLFAGTPNVSGFTDGDNLTAQFFEPFGLFLSENGDLYVADSANHAIRKISNGQVTTVAGFPGHAITETGYFEGGYIDGSITAAQFNFPKAVILFQDGLIVADSMNHAVRMIKDNTVITLLGAGQPGKYYGSVENIQLSRPEGIATDGSMLYVSDTLNNRVISVPITENLLNGRPNRDSMLQTTGITTDSRFAYRGRLRVYAGDEQIIGRTPAWNTPDHIFIPIRPFFEALGGVVHIGENVLSVIIDGQETVLTLNNDYFVRSGTAVTTLDEIKRLFPYYVEWYPEFNVIAVAANS